ncbi:MAG: hypothetical protein JWR19_2390 [Pedosphaera sp.]|jgi:hypothetical protein|nr:hypothetical protein [Pedosphaera sp.]
MELSLNVQKLGRIRLFPGQFFARFRKPATAERINLPAIVCVDLP